jgi:hypothetical protein
MRLIFSFQRKHICKKNKKGCFLFNKNTTKGKQIYLVIYRQPFGKNCRIRLLNEK